MNAPIRLQLTIAYDGRPFDGWQSQPSKNGVQDHLKDALEKILGHSTAIHGSGRTDAGVHALGQTAHVDVPDHRLPLASWVRALNANLPPEIRVLAVRKRPQSFHARYSAKAKEYHYRIWNGPVLPPLEIGRCWQVIPGIDPERLKTCASLLSGTHDFAAFAANRGTPAIDTVRTIFAIDIVRKRDLTVLRFRGNGFLYKMVRLLTGSIMRVATGKAEPQWLEALLLGSAGKSQYCAPAEGLYLVKVTYPPVTQSGRISYTGEAARES